jgi:hypothetical protein
METLRPYNKEREKQIVSDFESMLGHISQSKDAVFQVYRKMGRRYALEHASRLLHLPVQERSIVVEMFNSLPIPMARDAYHTFLQTEILKNRQLRELLKLPLQGPIFPSRKPS